MAQEGGSVMRRSTWNSQTLSRTPAKGYKVQVWNTAPLRHTFCMDLRGGPGMTPGRRAAIHGMCRSQAVKRTVEGWVRGSFTTLQVYAVAAQGVIIRCGSVSGVIRRVGAVRDDPGGAGGKLHVKT